MAPPAGKEAVAGDGDGGGRARGLGGVVRRQAGRFLWGGLNANGAAVICARCVDLGAVETDFARAGERDAAAVACFAAGGDPALGDEGLGGFDLDRSALAGAGGVEDAARHQRDRAGAGEDAAPGPGQAHGGDVGAGVEFGQGVDAHVAAGRAAGVQLAGEFHGPGGDLDAAAGVRLAGDVQRAGVADVAVLARVEEDTAALAPDALGGDDAFVVDGRPRQLVEGARAQDDRAVVGADGALVLDQRVEGPPG